MNPSRAALGSGLSLPLVPTERQPVRVIVDARLQTPASARILQAHVDEGLKLARRYRLPRPLADFIPEHQGRLKMGYFLHRARELDPTVAEASFRYRGPAPRSRETAILMLVAHWFQNRSAVVEGAMADLPQAANALIDLHRLGWVSA